MGPETEIAPSEVLARVKVVDLQFSPRSASIAAVPRKGIFIFYLTRAASKNVRKMPTPQLTTEAKDAFIIFDENYEGDNVDAFYLGDILRALGCNVTNAICASKGMTEALGVARITYDEFLP